MKVLHIAINSDLNLLAQAFADYLVDAGHFVYIPTDKDQRTLSWKSRYKHNLKLIDKEHIKHQQIDYLIDLYGELSESDLPKIGLDVNISNEELYIATYLVQSKNQACILENRVGKARISDSITTNLAYIVHQTAETFIDAVIILLRESDTLVFNEVSRRSQGLVGLLDALSSHNTLNEFYHELEKRDDVFCLQKGVSSQNKEIKIRTHLPLGEDDLKVFTLSLLALLNSNESGVYGFDISFGSNRLSKFVEIKLSDSYCQLVEKIHQDIFDIIHNPFAYGSLTHPMGVGSLISYEPINSHRDTYSLFIGYDKVHNELIIQYRNEFPFFESFVLYSSDYIKGFQQFKNGKLLLKDLNAIAREFTNKCLLDWNDTGKEYPADKTIHQLFEEQVVRYPDTVAVTFEDQHITYYELNTRANQLAHYLRDQGVQPEMLIVIICDRSIEMMIGILAILKAGGAYVPIDPSYPSERIQLIFEATKTPVILTCQNICEKLSKTASRVVVLDKQDFGSNPSTNPFPIAESKNLAYVIYTSGSTGRPKGVLIEHKSIVHSTHARSFYYKEKPSRFLLLSSYAFDSSIAGIFWTLLEGGTLIIPSGNSIEPSQIEKLVLQHQVTHLLCIPSLYAALQEILANKENKIISVIVAGEAAQPNLIEKHQVCFPSTSLFNEYGPTEATVWASVSNLYDKSQKKEKVTIGRPISNTKLYILNKHREFSPIGVSGELYIGGDGLARGYHNRPELTEMSFIENPFQTSQEKAQGKNAKLYKTGDLCRFLPDGDIEYLGRCDNQVKIRGFRIELGEIETALLKQPFIKEAVVIVREDIPGHQKLVGYVVLRDHKNQNLGEVALEKLRSSLQRFLPEFMIPSTFVLLEAIPLTPNSKVDRKSLPMPQYLHNDTTHVAPRTDLEQVLCEIWQDILKVESVGVHDDFFKLGGDSMKSIRLINRLCQKFGIRLPIKEIFKFRTVEALSDKISINQQVGNGKYD